MRLYKVAVGSANYHGSGALTYSWDDKIKPGTVVEIPLRDKRSLGIVLSETSQSVKSIKAIIKAHDTHILSAKHISLLKWMNAYYPGNFGATARLFLPTNVVDKAEITNQTSPKPKPMPTMTVEQAASVKQIDQSSSSTVMLHGDTGSGKTRVYLELAKKAFANKQSVIVLTPEISLSPQLAESFEAEFPGAVTKIHSKLSISGRNKIWSRLNADASPHIIIGPRSALFAPLKDIGLIIVDEAHDDSYKQEQAPHYDARRVASKLALLSNAKCIFGSATPDIGDYFLMKKNKVSIVRMKIPAIKGVKKAQHIVVNNRDRQLFSKSSFLSDQLLSSVQDMLDDNLQSLIFLNRRGTARMAICENCGWQSTCKKCDIGLVYHGDSHKMICHTCGHTETPPNTCQECGSASISFKSHGTKSIEKEIKKHFPSAKTMRFDSDNKTKERIDTNFTLVKDGSVDILIGTQVIGKGLHLPKLGLVGVPFADTGLSIPDFTSEEKAYQLLHQVLGRVGRTKVKTKTIIQTYTPEKRLLGFALKNDWQGFYESQLLERKKYNYPPFCYLLQLSCRKKTKAGVKNSAQKLATEIRSSHQNLTVTGPSPRFHEKTNDAYNWHIVIRSKNRSNLTNIIKELPSGWKYNIDPVNLL